MLTREQVAMRIAQELRDGDCANLGVGIPMLVTNYVLVDIEVAPQSENGLLRMGEFPDETAIDADVISTGRQTVTAQTGTAIFDSTQSFAMIRDGHVDLTILGALEVDIAGNIVLWMVPERMVRGVGGAVDPVAGAQNIIMVMTHVSKNGESRLLSQCTLPLTGVDYIRRVFTDLALLDIVDGMFILHKVAPGVSPNEVIRKTAGRLIVADDVREIRFSQGETVTNTAIVAVVYTPVGSFHGAFTPPSAVDLGAVAVRSLLERGQLSVAAVDELIFGQILTAGCGQSPTRQTALRADLPIDTPAVTVSLVCGSRLEAVQQTVQAVRCDDVEVVITGNQESMSDAPHLMHGAYDDLHFDHTSLQDSTILDGLWDVFNDYHMGIAVENLADAFDISHERQGASAAGSQRKAAVVIATERSREGIVPVSVPQGKKPSRVATSDEQPHPEANEQQLTQLRLVFRPTDGSVTTENASSLSDDTTTVLLIRVDKAHEPGLPVLAHIVNSAVAGVDPSVVGISPVGTHRRALQRAGWMLGEMDLIEASEAFTVQVLAVDQLLEWDSEKVNVSGGAIALDHPTGASGCWILVSLVYETQRRDANKGPAALCVGGGQSTAMTLQC